MEKLRIGILGPSEIAFRRFLPALKKSEHFEYVGVAIATLQERNQSALDQVIVEKSKAKAANFQSNFGGVIFDSYEEMLNAKDIDALYIPLPPAMHYFWTKKALECAKHVLVEKPSTTNFAHTKALVTMAENRKLALHENYAFCYHTQLKTIKEWIAKGEIGEVRQIRTTFAYPYRGISDFRYYKEMGGGALLDCGGYPIKLASSLLGPTTRLMTSSLCCAREHDVDVFGSATFQNNKGITAQISFGMDNSYKCELEVVGSYGVINAPRVFTAPANENVTLILNNGNDQRIEIQAEDQFLSTIRHFYQCIVDSTTRFQEYGEVEMQSRFVSAIFEENTMLRV